MDKRPRHGEYRDPVALGGDEQLLKCGFRIAPPKADQDTPRGLEDAPALWVERHPGRNPVCRHVFPICVTTARCEIDVARPRLRVNLWTPRPLHRLWSAAAPRSALSIILYRPPLGQTMARIGMQL